MSDPVLLDMSRMIGEIHGTLKSMEQRHDQTMETLEKHDGRISHLEETKNKAHGFAIAFGGLSGAIGTYLTHVVGVFK